MFPVTRKTKLYQYAMVWPEEQGQMVTSARRIWKRFSSLGRQKKRWAAAYANAPLLHQVSESARTSAGRIRSDNHPPAIMIYGVMPRSGTVMVGELLRRHPDLCAYPNELWEIPFLQQIHHLTNFEDAFFNDYSQNRERMQGHDLLALFGAAFLGYLHDQVPPGQRMLVKEAGIHYLRYLPMTFPQEQALLLMRDGRDLVHSTLRTWPAMDFSSVCQEWRQATGCMLEFHASQDSHQYWLARYEDALVDQPEFIKRACAKFGLDVERYPFDELEDVKVIGSSTMSNSGDVDWSQHQDKPKEFMPSKHWEAWGEKDKDTFKKIAGTMLIEAGYAQDLNW